MSMYIFTQLNKLLNIDPKALFLPNSSKNRQRSCSPNLIIPFTCKGTRPSQESLLNDSNFHPLDSEKSKQHLPKDPVLAHSNNLMTVVNLLWFEAKLLILISHLRFLISSFISKLHVTPFFNVESVG